MAEQTEVAADVETRAKEAGWVPADEFRGDPDKWVDAQTYWDKAQHVLPIVKHHRDRLQKEVTELRGELSTLQRTIQEGQAAMEDFKKYHEEDAKRRVKEAQDKLIEEIKQARADNDVDKELVAQGALNKLTTEPPANRTQVEQPKFDPAFLAWAKENPWLTVEALNQTGDADKSAYAYGAAQILRVERKDLSGRAFLDELKKRVQDRYPELGPERSRSEVSKVEGSRGGASQAASGSASGYSDLPADAKAQCDADAERFVGPNKVYKTVKEWREHYVRLYNG